MKTMSKHWRLTGLFALGVASAFSTANGAEICISLLRSHPSIAQYRTARAFSGYLPQLLSLQPQAPHTLHSLDELVTAQLGSQTRQLIEKSHSPVFIILGHLRTARARLARMGWRIDETLSQSGTWFRVVRLSNARGETGVAVIRVISWDRLTHIQALFRLAGLAPSRLHTLWRNHSLKTDYLKTFGRLGAAPDLVVYGFAHTALFGLINSISLNQSHFAFAKDSHRLKKEYVTRHDLNLPQFMHQITLKNGKRIWLLPNVYGDLVHDLLLAAVEHGTRHMLFLGTAGALDRGYAVGDWVTPTDSSQSAPLPGVSTRGHYERVESYLLETETWLHYARQRGVDYVDVEWGYLSDLTVSQPQVTLRHAFVISDVLDPLARQNITVWSEEHSKRLEPQITRMLQAALGLNSLEDLQIDAIVRELLAQD